MDLQSFYINLVPFKFSTHMLYSSKTYKASLNITRCKIGKVMQKLISFAQMRKFWTLTKEHSV